MARGFAVDRDDVAGLDRLGAARDPDHLGEVGGSRDAAVAEDLAVAVDAEVDVVVRLLALDVLRDRGGCCGDLELQEVAAAQVGRGAVDGDHLEVARRRSIEVQHGGVVRAAGRDQLVRRSEGHGRLDALTQLDHERLYGSSQEGGLEGEAIDVVLVLQAPIGKPWRVPDHHAIEVRRPRGEHLDHRRAIGREHVREEQRVVLIAKAEVVGEAARAEDLEAKAGKDGPHPDVAGRIVDEEVGAQRIELAERGHRRGRDAAWSRGVVERLGTDGQRDR